MTQTQRRPEQQPICVISKSGKPLASTRRPGRVRHLLQDGRARIVWARKLWRAGIKEFLWTHPGYTAVPCLEAQGVDITETMWMVGVERGWPPVKVARQVALCEAEKIGGIVMVRLKKRHLLVLPVALSFTLAAGFLFPLVSTAPAAPPRAKERQPITMEVLTTGYTAYDSGEDGKGMTFTGTRARPGVAAVDPKVIPLGTVLWVPGYSQLYGPVKAEDVGGLVNGKHIDLFFKGRQEAMEWGRRSEPVTVLR